MRWRLWALGWSPGLRRCSSQQRCGRVEQGAPAGTRVVPKRRAADETLASIAKSYAVDISMISHAGVNFGGEGQPLDCEIVSRAPDTRDPQGAMLAQNTHSPWFEILPRPTWRPLARKPRRSFGGLFIRI